MNNSLELACKLLTENDIEFTVKNENQGLIHCRKKISYEMVQYYAMTGTIVDHDEKGIHNLIIILSDDKNFFGGITMPDNFI